MLARKTDLNQYPLNHGPLTFSLVMNDYLRAQALVDL